MSESDRQALRGKTAASLRAANLSLVLREIVAATTPPSRAALAAKLGMTRSTVSRLVDDLGAGRCVTEGDAQNVGRGRPAVPLYPAAGTLLALGIEINVGRTVVSVVDLGGNTVASRVVERESAELGPEATLGLVAREAADLLDELPVGARVVGAHLVVPGLVDR
ncbi:MAG: hypothetical protein GX596_04750, partial [Propionibacterium sp.]|nr:hypothetical protein [Propionibacterium sp.]